MAFFGHVDKYKAFDIADTILAVLALFFGLGLILSGIGLGVGQFMEPFTTGLLGILVGAIFLLYGLRHFSLVQ